MKVLSEYVDPHELGVEQAAGAMSAIIGLARSRRTTLCQRCAATEAYRQAVDSQTPAGRGMFWNTMRVARDAFLLDAMRDDCECGRVA